MERFTFWNNKGGTGKTTLAFQVICEYANENPDQKILVIDVCPQANLSELLLGGLNNGGSDNLLKRQRVEPRSTIGGYFQVRLPSPYIPPNFQPSDFITNPSQYNPHIPPTIDLLCGDPLLELQSNAISTLANNQIPGTNTWLVIINWINDFINHLDDEYAIIFFDANPSFSIYTQIALAATDKLILPVMADDSSRRAIQNVFSLIYGLKLPSEIYTRYAFAEKLKEVSQPLPKVHIILKNRLTQYMGPASAYFTVLSAIDTDVKLLLEKHPEIFTFNELNDGVVNIIDFQTTGVVASALGCPFYELNAGSHKVLGKEVQIRADYKKDCVTDIQQIVKKI